MDRVAQVLEFVNKNSVDRDSERPRPVQLNIFSFIVRGNGAHFGDSITCLYFVVTTGLM